MESEFYQLFKDLPVPELVRVARTPADHQPEAVTAAERILKERGITRAEIAAEEWDLAQKEMADALKRPRRSDFIAGIKELFGNEKLTSPSDRWFLALLVLYGCYYTYHMYITIKQDVWLFQCKECSFLPDALAWDLGYATYITLCLYFLLKQKWPVWSLLLIHTAMYTCFHLSVLLHAYTHHQFYLFRFYYHIIQLFVYAAFAVILWRPYVLTSFNINAKIKSRTLLVAVVAAIGIVFLTV